MLLSLMCRAVWPPLRIEECLKNWNTIQRDLAERRRDRMPRINSLLS